MAATTATIEYKRPWVYDKQRAAIFHDKRYGVVEASTKSGKTVGCLIWLAEQAMQGRAGRNYWWVAPSYSQAEMAYSRMKRAFPQGMLASHSTKLTHRLPNGAIIWFKRAEKPDNLYGEDVYAAVVDEASRCRQESWHALRSTLTATRGPVRIIGNVKGRRNWAYRLARRAEAGEPNMAYARITAHDAVAAGVLDAAEIKDAQGHMPDNVFRELYLAEASDDDGKPFGLDAIRACIGTYPGEPPVVWGWDLAKSVDWTVGVGLDANGRTCKFERFQKPWPETNTRIRQITGTTLALVDSTGVGDAVVDHLQLDGRTNFEGFKFTSPSKQQLMEGLTVAIQQHAITYPEGPIVNELESFEYIYSRTGVRYSAPEGLHDDCVMALALAVRLLNRPRVEPMAWTL